MAAGADEDCRAALAVRLVAARESLGRHLAHEESDAMRILQAHFAPADWEELDERFKEGITFGKVVALVPWALSEVPASALPDLFARTGGAAPADLAADPPPLRPAGGARPSATPGA